MYHPPTDTQVAIEVGKFVDTMGLGMTVNEWLADNADPGTYDVQVLGSFLLVWFDSPEVAVAYRLRFSDYITSNV